MRYCFKRAYFSTLILVGILGLGGCFGTVAPKPVASGQGSFDNGTNNSGFLGWTNYPTLHSAIESQLAINRYNALALTWGKDFTPPLKPWDGVTMILAGKTSTNYVLDAEHLADFLLMSSFQRSTFHP